MAKVIFKICPYKPKSAGARYLAEALEELLGYPVERVTHDYQVADNVWLINWGSGDYYAERQAGAKNTKVLNPAHKIVRCINKTDCFRVLAETDVSLPQWTLRHATARRWAEAGHVVYCRGDVEGMDGRGLQVATSPASLTEASLYTRGEESTHEYRVHVFKHMPIFDLLKWHEQPTKAANRVRTGGNGWEFTRHCVMPPLVRQQAVLTSRALDMDFCAVDILWNQSTNRPTVLEVNSAPELGPWTSVAYAKHLAALI